MTTAKTEFDKATHDRLVLEITRMLATRTSDPANLSVILESVMVSVMFMLRRVYGGSHEDVRKIAKSMSEQAIQRYNNVVEKADADD